MHYCNIKQLRNIIKLGCPKNVKSWHNKIFLPVLGQASLFNSQYFKNNINVIFLSAFNQSVNNTFSWAYGMGERNLFLFLPESKLSLPRAGRDFRVESQKSPTEQIPQTKKQCINMSKQKLWCGSCVTGVCHQHSI